MPNRLQHQNSAYLQQHAANPVDWYPWCEAALARARAEDRPILLSIGYSACHWCHVMAHESFEDPATARLMNEGFINIKVDREERPDLDQIYQAAHQLLARRSGGWPLTVFLTPDQVPFFAGTYYPPEPRHGLPAFTGLLERVLLAYRTERAMIESQNGLILAALERTGATDQPAPAALPDASVLEAAAAALQARFDPEHGGFGAAPKFPHPSDLELCLRAFARCADRQSLHVALHSLRRMAEGGLYDQIGGGFFRYSVDASWTIPHFEKMLCDNALLLPLYADAWAITGEPLFERVVVGTAGWVMREMQAADGAYAASLDADSEGGEGRFYLWTPEEVRPLLEPADYGLFAQHYGLADPPNYPAEGTGSAWHLRVARSVAAIAEAEGLALEAVRSRLDAAAGRLFAARERRPPPGCDRKALTSWNALMIAGMAHAARVLDRDDWARSARRASDRLLASCWDGQRLLALAPGGASEGTAPLPGYLDDYAFLLKALLALAAWSGRAEDLRLAEALAQGLLDRFEDRARGGFYFTAHDHERLIHRPRQGFDQATPAGNAIAAQALGRLGHLTGQARYLEAAARAVRAFAGDFRVQPAAFGAILVALGELLQPPLVLVLRGTPGAFADWHRALAGAYRPQVILFTCGDAPQGLPQTLAHPLPAAGCSAYLCREQACLAPVHEPGALAALLDAGAALEALEAGDGAA